MGEPKTAVDLTEKGLKLHTDLGMPFWRSMCHWFCSHAYFALGDMEQAITHAELALQFSLENNERQWQGLFEDMAREGSCQNGSNANRGSGTAHSARDKPAGRAGDSSLVLFGLSVARGGLR